MQLSDLQVNTVKDVFLEHFPAMKDRPDMLERMVDATAEALEALGTDSGGELPAPVTVRPPADWATHTRSALQQYERVRLRTLVACGLESPIEWGAIGRLVETLDSQQRSQGTQRGASTILEYPVAVHHEGEEGWSVEAREITVYAGFTEEEAAEQLASVLEARKSGDEDGPSWMPSPLFSLARDSQRIALETGVSALAVGVFLLSDEPLSIPWIQATVYRRPAVGATCVRLEIGTTEVTPAEVAQAYREARSCARLKPVEDLPLVDSRIGFLSKNRSTVPEYKRTQARVHTQAMIDYVDAYKQKRKATELTAAQWDELCSSWSDSFAETYRPYKSGKSMSAAYSAATIRRRGKAAAAAEGPSPNALGGDSGE